MATYAIGDVQGCYDELQDLLTLIQFNPQSDRLWFAGDLVNRGPKSLAVLRFVKSLANAVMVLGNHELHLLALANGRPHKNHSLAEILAAPDRKELLDWLRWQPLLHYDAQLNYVMVHAGILPQWNLMDAKRYAQEVEGVLRSSNFPQYLQHMYGEQPLQWRDELTGWDRLRFITNVFTRMRFCTNEGKLDLTTKGAPGSQPPGYMPWFEVPNRKTQTVRIVFGHWAVLAGRTNATNVFALDTGCVYGGSLTALRLEDAQRFSVRSKTTKL